jgi:hypothetical protein
MGLLQQPRVEIAFISSAHRLIAGREINVVFS